MANLQNFDASTVEPMGDFEPLPAGKYLVVITESEMKPTKAGDGEYLELVFEVVEGEYKNRKLWARLNLNNSSQKAVEIAKGKLSAVCRAVGVMTPNESAELHNIPLQVRVKCRKREDTGDIVNDVSAFYHKPAAGQS